MMYAQGLVLRSGLWCLRARWKVLSSYFAFSRLLIRNNGYKPLLWPCNIAISGTEVYIYRVGLQYTLLALIMSEICCWS